MDKEIEVRFLEIDKDALVKNLLALGAEDRGEKMLEEVIVYDAEKKWQRENRFVRLRGNGTKTTLVYKEHSLEAKGEAKEIEFEVGDFDKTIEFLEAIGLVAYRRQQKKRHTLVLGDVTFDIDTWPRIPTYAELEGPSMAALKDAAAKVGLDWEKVTYEDARYVIEKIYHIPVGSMTWFTFDRFE